MFESDIDVELTLLRESHYTALSLCSSEPSTCNHNQANKKKNSSKAAGRQKVIPPPGIEPGSGRYNAFVMRAADASHYTMAEFDDGNLLQTFLSHVTVYHSLRGSSE